MTLNPASAVLGRFPTVLLDFDGPICSIFSGFTSAEVAAALRERLGLGTAAPDSTDPFDVLRAAAEDSFGSAAKANRHSRSWRRRPWRPLNRRPGRSSS